MIERVTNALKDLHQINETYDLPNEVIDNTLQEIADAKVCTPIIGKFSSGKSALVNTILGYNSKILREDITPETAVPTEILYCEDDENAAIIYNNGTYQQINVDQYRSLEVNATTVQHTKLNLTNKFLSEIPDVMLVDMPGFESGYEVHNKAIDNYLPQSMAYIITFPADDMIVRSSVGNILKELCLHDMPLCIVITKYDKCNDDFEETFSALKENLKRYIGERNVTYCKTSSFLGDAEEIEEFLRTIQEQSQKILFNKYRTAALSSISTTESYLNSRLNSSTLSESELAEQEEKLQKQLTGLNDSFSNDKNNFGLEISECVDEIKADVQSALEAEESTFVAMAMNNQDINERLNIIVRSAVTTSVQKRLLPKITKYLKRVSKHIDGEAIDKIHVYLLANVENTNNGIVSTIVAAVAGVLFSAPALGILMAGLMFLVNKIAGNKKREEVKNQLKVKLRSEVFPQVLQSVGRSIETAITKQVELLNTSIEQEIAEQQAVLEKALEDVRKEKIAENDRKENLLNRIRADLERLAVMKNEL